MIQITRLNGEIIHINAELIEMIEATPDTIIKFNTGNKLVVKEPVEEIRRQIIEYKREIFKFYNKNKEV